jgi:WD40 repeat protein
MILVWEDQMNQMIYADKKGYFVYDERGEKGSDKLRHVTGAHQSSITVITFSYFLSLIATGTESGEVAVWDYELSQLLAICRGHSESNGEITAIEFLQPYPVMITAGQDSKICLWSVRPTPVE